MRMRPAPFLFAKRDGKHKMRAGKLGCQIALGVAMEDQNFVFGLVFAGVLACGGSVLLVVGWIRCLHIAFEIARALHVSKGLTPSGKPSKRKKTASPVPDALRLGIAKRLSRATWMMRGGLLLIGAGIMFAVFWYFVHTPPL